MEELRNLLHEALREICHLQIAWLFILLKRRKIE